MSAKFFLLAAVVAVANAGYIGAPTVGYAAAPAITYAAAPAAIATPAITSQQSNILRSYGNLGQVSTYSKTIDTPYSSVRKSDVRVSNDALAYPVAPALAATAYHTAPVAAAYAAPAYAAPAYAAPAYAAPAYAAPAYAAPAYAAPAVKTAATAVVGHGLLGVAYSAAPAVAHMTYSNGLGIAYSY